MSGDRAGSGRDRTGQDGAASGALAAFEIAVAGADDQSAWWREVAIHCQTHGATGLAPFGAGFQKDAVQALGLGCLLGLL